MFNHNTKPALFVLLFTLAQTALFVLTGAAIWPLLAAPVLLLGYLYWPTPQQTDNSAEQAEQLANTADNITQATSKMAIGAAEVSFYIDGLIKDIQHSSEDSGKIADVSNMLASTSTQLTHSLQSIGATLQHTANASAQADTLLSNSVKNINNLVQAVSQAAAADAENPASNWRRERDVI